MSIPGIGEEEKSGELPNQKPIPKWQKYAALALALMLGLSYCMEDVDSEAGTKRLGIAAR